jgi:hypothetical protein
VAFGSEELRRRALEKAALRRTHVRGVADRVVQGAASSARKNSLTEARPVRPVASAPKVIGSNTAMMRNSAPDAYVGPVPRADHASGLGLRSECRPALREPRLQ